MKTLHMSVRKVGLGVVSALLATGLSTTTLAADYPSKPIQMIVAFGAGGSTDTMARIFAKYVEEELGQRVVVVNRPGAGGELGWVHLANAAPDGYTIGLINSPVVEVYPFTREESVGYSLDDLRPLANVITDPGMLVVAADSPYQNLDDFVAAVQSDPESIIVSHEGIGGDDHLAALNFAAAADIDLNFVAYNGNAEATASLLGGHITAFAGNMSEAVTQIQEGKARGLAIWSEERGEPLPDVPTGREQGYDVQAAASRGFAMPADVPQEIYDLLLEASRNVIDNPEFRAEMERLNMPVDPIYGQDYVDFIDASHTRLKALWEQDPWVEQ
ncbi:tripartite tricarboxylate transporter substrate binding protein [Halomonas sp. ML-15]|uniref:tripartite tricarboxylate transporter substrate binding protein n=1 Tax=Halomonas sp. ML-15 TaxID=2773305 RepID=UPI001746AA16|nr:tripartite tricarboxylate transporter substrate binding protein [Halomonas sp. ML-15]MBD3896798.1 tripartite tricarboxylate transporter substrate binding protein [Halomonas sp. ML-15]